MTTTIEPRRVQWRMLTLGATVWSPRHGWAPATIIGLGKNRGDRTVVSLKFETGGRGRRVAGELWWRKPELRGRDKPPRLYESLPPGYRKRIESERIEVEGKDKPKAQTVAV